MAAEPMDLDSWHPWEISPDQAIELATRCENAALESDALIQNSEGATVSTGSTVLRVMVSIVGVRGKLTAVERKSFLALKAQGECPFLLLSSNGDSVHLWPLHWSILLFNGDVY